MSSRWRRSVKFAREMARLMVGVPDYDNYVKHRTLNHPGEPVMSYEVFFRERQESRYNSRKCTTRCC
ncbi:YbdD/YjiX family protein [Pseudomonas lurida]|uniref:YbdD/YjiX family protein n=1 Tax=Pseudomonas lurida TaxID=244566 RepID=UPI0016442EEA|nr:CstA-like transporter-associated (seleno)protein [Pseudomonas lurida]MBC3245155.1 YbdD/YjiX family protein [Pseudomonas lurida]MBC8978966.1 YbdD/YjiX family protein [Pseudomonas lurida]